MENWKDVVGFEGLYKVSDCGRIMSFQYYGSKNTNIIIGSYDKDGYRRVTLFKDGVRNYKRVHRLVAEAFLPNPQLLEQVNHKDEIKDNNNLFNLEWCDSNYNINYGTGIKKRSVKISKRVGQFDLNGKLIRTFNSTQETKLTGYVQQCVSRCCLKQRTHYRGYIWKYLEE